jgi:Na+/H+ antiporter
VLPATFAVLLVCLPLVAAAAGWVAERTGVPLPVLLVGAGVLLGLAPGLHPPELSPQVVLFVFLPPLVYYAAYFIAPEELRANAWPIGLLAVGLVMVGMAVVSAVMVWVAGVSLGVAAVVGAVVAPTDSVAPTSIFQRLSVPERLVTIVEAEGMINDGTALVLYAAAVDAVVAGTLRPKELAVTLLVGPVGGAALGLGIAWVLVWARRRLDQPLVEITLSLATPYLAYVLAEAAQMSGVLATVSAGVYVGSRTWSIYGPTARLQAFAFLEVLVFLLNAVLFTLVGMQLVRVVTHALQGPTERVLIVMTAVTAVVVGSRMIWTLLGPAAARLRGHTEQSQSWREGVVIGWAGVRGGVSLAAAMAVPLRLADGSPFPDRDLVIAAAAAIIVVTLMAQGMSLPWLLRKLGIASEDTSEQEHLARLQAARAALAALEDHATAEGTDDAIESLRALYTGRAQRLEAADEDRSSESSSGPGNPQRYLALRRELLGVERSAALKLRQQGRITAAVYRIIERDLDLEEARISGS